MREWSFEETAAYILYIAEKRADERLLQRWVMHYEDRIGFEDFKAMLTAGARQRIATPAPFIEADVAKICKMKVEG